jgi:membrane protein DedA with SNARE-associated domain
VSASLAAWPGLVEAHPVVLAVLVGGVVAMAAAYTGGRLLRDRLRRRPIQRRNPS